MKSEILHMDDDRVIGHDVSSPFSLAEIDP